ncbi:uncharacterized protein LOC127265408 [Andrographis paniculata]|uniref:uncharacterized protein LOC127265408 n=1 Tax=Andrographis paniculata TaxID=175694 RepID=UPI0021E8FD28|nr:uncharacterized protein LOC127265408 [Andrographis paniculata]
MRGKSSSSSKSRNGGLEFEKVEKSKEPQLSGAYIRSLVKQLTSSRTKDSSNLNEYENLEEEGNQSSCRNHPSTRFSDQKQETSSNQSLCISSCEGFSDEKSHLPPQQHKKQVRRRLHASRPYQERLLNMAEARREIVTALKFHRAAMKQASEKQQQQQQQLQQQPNMESGPENQPYASAASHHLCLEQEAKLKSRRNPRIYASNSSVPNSFPANYMDGISSYSPGYCCPYSWSLSPMAPPPIVQENLNFTLPSQPLGLNLNLQDFSNLDATAFNCSTNPSSIFSYSASTSSSPVSAYTDENPCFEAAPPSVAAEAGEYGDSGMHPVMDDKEIAEIRSIGEQYEMEWNDTVNLVNSAWWFKFLKETEMKPENQQGEYFVNSPFDEVMEFPAWLNANESCLQHVNDHCSDGYYPEPALPCMDIEEIEGMDGDWLA